MWKRPSVGCMLTVCKGIAAYLCMKEKDHDNCQVSWLLSRSYFHLLCFFACFSISGVICPLFTRFCFSDFLSTIPLSCIFLIVGFIAPIILFFKVFCFFSSVPSISPPIMTNGTYKLKGDFSFSQFLSSMVP